jgi:molybdopterin-containing oxidoreductase family membrane subunit
MSSHNESILREPLITGKNITYSRITEEVLMPVENKPNRAWWIGFIVAAAGACLWLVAVSYTFWTGIGSWGLVGRYWSRRNFNFCGITIIPSKLEKLY